MQRVLVEIVARVNHDPALRDSVVYQLHPFCEEGLISEVMSEYCGRRWCCRQSQAVRDHNRCALCSYHINQRRIIQAAGVVDHRGSRREAASSDLWTEGIDGDDDVAELRPAPPGTTRSISSANVTA